MYTKGRYSKKHAKNVTLRLLLIGHRKNIAANTAQIRPGLSRYMRGGEAKNTSGIVMDLLCKMYHTPRFTKEIKGFAIYAASRCTKNITATIY
jgi:hypothetical protein